MEELDTEKLARVWCRVRGTTDTDALQQMLELTQTAAAHCGILSRMHRGNKRQLLQQMARQNRSAAECLAGICSVNGCKYAVSMPKGLSGPLRQKLLSCYTCQQQLVGLLDARTVDPQFGYLYSQLSQQAKTHCQQLLQLLGTQP